MIEIAEKLYTALKAEDKITLQANYVKDTEELLDWKLYVNYDLLIDSFKKVSYLSLWKEALELIIDINKIIRVLIVGGGNQFLSNYILKFPCDITILDPLCYTYLEDEDFVSILKLKHYVNTFSSEDDKLRKLVLLDMTLKEAFEDDCFSPGEFDLIMVDNFIDNLNSKTGIFNESIPIIYHTLLRDKGFLIINQLFSIKKITKKSLLDYNSDYIKVIKQSNKYYAKYLSTLNSLLCETDFIGKYNQRIAVYSKVYTGNS